MNAVDSREHEVLDRTLEEVRRVRRCRAAWKLAMLPFLLLIGVGWLGFSHTPPTGIGSPQPVTAEAPRTAKTTGESLTVVEWRGGLPSLVQYSGEELGKLELTFSLEPVVAFPEEIW